MRLFAAYILISFVAIAVLGFTGLTSHNSLFSRCVEATVPGGLPCDGQDMASGNVLAAIYQGFSAALISVIVLLAISLVAFCRAATGKMREEIFSTASKFESKTHSSIIKYNLWSELHQQHPARV